MAEPEAREIELTGSKVIDDLLTGARESGMIVKITEKASEYGRTWGAEFRIPIEAQPGNMLHLMQEHDHMTVHWSRADIKGRRPRFLHATRWGLTSHKNLKNVKDMHRELASMRRDAEKITARLALRKGGESWRLETRDHQQQTLSARPVTLEHAERLIARADEIMAVLPEEVRFWLFDRDRYSLVRCALVPADAPQWRELGELTEDAGDVGGDIQIGAAPERRFTHATLPGRVVDVTAYPIKGDGSNPMPPEDAPIHVSWQRHLTTCGDITDPGGTEQWADVRYPEVPKEFAGPYATVEEAEAAARRLVAEFDPSGIEWDGDPAWGADEPHGYTWADVRRVDARELKVGDIFVSPGVGNLYRVGDDGRVTGTTWALDGTAWVVGAWAGDVLTAVSHTGQERRQRPFPGAMVLRVEPSGTCDRCAREVRPWPLERGDRCAPKGWAYCIRRA
jgi:hypothetical protein